MKCRKEVENPSTRHLFTGFLLEVEVEEVEDSLLEKMETFS
jgi:hypothetical protein